MLGEPRASGELLCGNPLAAFQVHSLKPQPSTLPANDIHLAVGLDDCSGNLAETNCSGRAFIGLCEPAPDVAEVSTKGGERAGPRLESADAVVDLPCGQRPVDAPVLLLQHGREGGLSRVRSEEHTSELQSPMYLVCRLLLEKKKKEQSQ